MSKPNYIYWTVRHAVDDYVFFDTMRRTQSLRAYTNLRIAIAEEIETETNPACGDDGEHYMGDLRLRSVYLSLRSAPPGQAR